MYSCEDWKEEFTFLSDNSFDMINISRGKYFFNKILVLHGHASNTPMILTNTAIVNIHRQGTRHRPMNIKTPISYLSLELSEPKPLRAI